jgi:hypothetical protein
MKHFYNAGDREYGLSVFTTASNSRKTGEFAIFESEADWPVEKGDCRTGTSDKMSDSGHFLTGECDRRRAAGGGCAEDYGFTRSGRVLGGVNGARSGKYCPFPVVPVKSTSTQLI